MSGDRDLDCFATRRGQAAAILTGSQGQQVIEAALRRARAAVDIDTILESCRY